MPQENTVASCRGRQDIAANRICHLANPRDLKRAIIDGEWLNGARVCHKTRVQSEFVLIFARGHRVASRVAKLSRHGYLYKTSRHQTAIAGQSRAADHTSRGCVSAGNGVSASCPCQRCDAFVVSGSIASKVGDEPEHVFMLARRGENRKERSTASRGMRARRNMHTYSRFILHRRVPVKRT